MLGCLNGHVAVVWVLLKDLRVNVTLGDLDQCTPLWLASYNGRHEVIECLIASGRDLGDINKQGWDSGLERDCTALEIARENNQTEVVSLLQRFRTNPMKTRHEIRVRLGVLDELAAYLFALTIFSL